MQDAYVVDQQKAGTFAEIGFEAPTSNVFTYTDKNKSFSAGASALNKCETSQTWEVGVSVNDTTKQASYTPSTGCGNLTPNFTMIGSGRS